MSCNVHLHLLIYSYMCCFYVSVVYVIHRHVHIWVDLKASKTCEVSLWVNLIIYWLSWPICIEYLCIETEIRAKQTVSSLLFLRHHWCGADCDHHWLVQTTAVGIIWWDHLRCWASGRTGVGSVSGFLGGDRDKTSWYKYRRNKVTRDRDMFSRGSMLTRNTFPSSAFLRHCTYGG